MPRFRRYARSRGGLRLAARHDQTRRGDHRQGVGHRQEDALHLFGAAAQRFAERPGAPDRAGDRVRSGAGQAPGRRLPDQVRAALRLHAAAFLPSTFSGRRGRRRLPATVGTLWRRSRSAETAARNPQTVAYVGDLNTGATELSLPDPNQAGIVELTPGSGYPGLTDKVTGVTVTPGEPNRYYPQSRPSLLAWSRTTSWRPPRSSAG